MKAPIALGVELHVVTFDAMNTLVQLREPIGATYARLASSVGFASIASADALQADFWRHFKALSTERPCYGSQLQTCTKPLLPGTPPSGIEPQRQWWYDIVHRTFGASIAGDDAALVARRQRLAELLYDHFGRPDPWRMVDGAKPVLRALKARGVKIGVVSNWDARLRHTLAALLAVDSDDGVDVAQSSDSGLIDAYFLSGELAIEKPDAAIFRQAARLLNAFEPQCLLHVGDDYQKDYVGARSAGCHSLLFLRGRPRDDFPPDTVCIRALSDLMAMV